MTHVSRAGKRLRSFSGAAIPQGCSSADFDSTGLSSFDGSSALASITHLSVNDNPIRSFKGCCQLPKLLDLSIRRCPIGRNRDLKLMVLAFAPQIRHVNGELIPDSVRCQFSEFCEPDLGALLKQLSDGNVIRSLSPLRLKPPRDEREWYRVACATKGGEDQGRRSIAGQVRRIAAADVLDMPK